MIWKTIDIKPMKEYDLLTHHESISKEGTWLRAGKMVCRVDRCVRYGHDL